MPNKQLIQKKLFEILQRLRNLEELVKIKPKELFGKQKNYLLAERVMERLIGAAIDINMHLAKDLLTEIPDDYFQSFTTLSQTNIIPLNFAKKIAPSTSLRNIIVHEYQSIDQNKFYKSMKEALTQYERYATHIQRYLDTL